MYNNNQSQASLYQCNRVWRFNNNPETSSFNKLLQNSVKSMGNQQEKNNGFQQQMNLEQTSKYQTQRKTSTNDMVFTKLPMAPIQQKQENKTDQTNAMPNSLTNPKGYTRQSYQYQEENKKLKLEAKQLKDALNLKQQEVALKSKKLDESLKSKQKLEADNIKLNQDLIKNIDDLNKTNSSQKEQNDRQKKHIESQKKQIESQQKSLNNQQVQSKKIINQKYQQIKNLNSKIQKLQKQAYEKQVIHNHNVSILNQKVEVMERKEKQMESKIQQQANQIENLSRLYKQSQNQYFENRWNLSRPQNNPKIQ